jgi:hypothetical protein
MPVLLSVMDISSINCKTVKCNVSRRMKILNILRHFEVSLIWVAQLLITL